MQLFMRESITKQVIIKQQQDGKGNKLSYMEVDANTGQVMEEWHIAR